jgi:hypothetical protein
MKKICKKCKIYKNLSEFGKNKNKKDGLNIYCKNCELIRAQEYRKNNKEKSNLASKKYRKNNKEQYKKSVEKYLNKNPHMTSKVRMRKYRENKDWVESEKQRKKEYYLKNIEKLREKRKEYYVLNKEKERKLNNIWKNKKRKTDGYYRMKINLRHRLREYLIGESKGKKTKDIVGLDKVEFKLYIQSKFKKGMSWDNYGEWHLDHIIPLCSAKSEQDIILLNNYKNLQPLWAEENIKKNRKI